MCLSFFKRMSIILDVNRLSCREFHALSDSIITFLKGTIFGNQRWKILITIIFSMERFFINNYNIVEPIPLWKFICTNFWKRHSTQLELLFQMRLFSKYSTTLIRPTCISSGTPFLKMVHSTKQILSHDKILLIPSKDSPWSRVSMVKKSLW